MAYAAFCLATYALCFTSFLTAFPTKGFLGDWRHLNAGPKELRSSENGAWRRDGRQPLETKHKIYTDGDYDVIVPTNAHLATGDSKLVNSEKTNRTLPLLENNPIVVRTTDVRSQQPHHTPALRDSSRHDGEQSFKFKYGVLRLLHPSKLANHVEENDKSSDDNAGDDAAPDGDRSVLARSLDLQKTKLKSFRKKRDNSKDDIKTVEVRLLSADDEIEEYVSDECDRCGSPVRKVKRDTGNLSVEATTPNPIVNVSNNLNETSEKSGNNTDDSNKKPVPRLMDMQITTSAPPSTTIKHGQMKIEHKQEDPRAPAEMSMKSINVTNTEETDGLMGVDDDFAYIVDPQEIHLGQGRDMASGKFETSRGKKITLHWTIKFEPKSNASQSVGHPHPPADDGRDVYEQVVYLNPDTETSSEDGHTTDIPKHIGDISEYLDQLPLPNGAAQVFPNLQTGELLPIGQDQMADIALPPVMELLSQKPITQPSGDWFMPQDGLVDLLDQPSSDSELVEGLVDMDPGLPVLIPSFQEELVEIDTTDEVYEPDKTLDAPFDTETETLIDIPSVLGVEDIPTVPDMELVSQHPTAWPSEDFFTPVEELVDMESDILADTEYLISPVEQLVDMESETLADIEDLFMPGEELVDMESDTLADTEDWFMPAEELVDIESDTLADTEDWFTPDEELVDMEADTLADTEDWLTPDEELVDIESDTLADTEDWFTSDEELVDMESDTLVDAEDWFTPDEELVDMESDTLADTEDLFMPDEELVDMESDTLADTEDLFSPDEELVDMESDTLADNEDFFIPDEELVDMESDTLADTEDLFMPDEELVDMESDTLTDTEDWFMADEELVDMESDTLANPEDWFTLVEELVDIESDTLADTEDWFTPDEELVDVESDTLADTEDWFIPDEELVGMVPDTQADNEDWFTPDEELVVMESDTLADIPSVLEGADLPAAPDMDLLSQQPTKDWFTPEEGLVDMESNTLADIPSMLEVSDLPAAPDMELLPQQPSEDWFTPDEELVDMESDLLADIPSVLEVAGVPSVPDMELLSQQPSEDWFTPEEALVDMESDTLADILSVLEVADVPAAPDMELLSKKPSEDWLTPEEALVDMESETLVDIPSVLEVADVPAAPDMELLSQQPTTWQPEYWITPQDGSLYPMDQSSSDIELVDGLEPGVPVSFPSLQDDLVDMEIAGEDHEPDISLDEPVDIESAYFDPNTLAGSPSMLEVADLLTAPDAELVSQQLITEPPEDLLRPQEELVYTLDQPSSDILIDGPDGAEPILPVSIPSLQDEVVDMEPPSEDYEPDALLSIPSSLVEPTDMESESAYLDPNTLSNIPSMLEAADIPTVSDMELLLQPLAEQPESYITSQEGIVHPLEQSSSDIVQSNGPVGMEPVIPEFIPSLQDELVGMETADASLDVPLDTESDIANFDPITVADIPSILEVAGIPTTPDMDLLSQQPIAVPPEDSFMSQEALVYPQDHPSLDNVLIDGSVDMVTGIPVSIPSLQDELVDMETAGVDYNPDALLSIPSTGEQLDPDTLSNVQSSLNEPDAPTALAVYDEYGLEIYDQEDHTDHIGHAQATTCRCEVVSNDVVIDGP